MNRNEMIKKAARAMAAHTYIQADAWDVWVMDESVRDDYRRKARAVLESVGALPPEPLPVGTRKRSPGGAEAILTGDGDSYPWTVYKARAGETTGDWLTDADIADWEIITDTPATNDMHVVQDGPDAQDVVSETPKAPSTPSHWRTGSGIRTTPTAKATRRGSSELHAKSEPGLTSTSTARRSPEGHVTIDLSKFDVVWLKKWADLDASGDLPFRYAARAELARRGESA